MIKEYDEKFGHILGYRRMASWINHFNHTTYTIKRVDRIMKKLGIRAVIRRKRRNIGIFSGNNSGKYSETGFYCN